MAFLAGACHWAGIYDPAGLAHVLGLQSISGFGVSVARYLNLELPKPRAPGNASEVGPFGHYLLGSFHVEVTHTEYR